MFPFFHKILPGAIGLAGLCAAQAWAGDGAGGGFKLVATWASGGTEQELKSWDFGDLLHLKSVSSREKNPLTGKVESYRGILLSKLLEKALDQLPPDRRASVDLLVARNVSGGTAVIPRSLITKYPLMLALEKTKSASVVVPWTSHSRVKGEGLPLESYFIEQVNRIELTNSRERYSSLFLKRRTDPVAMRGEKIFVQDCAACHSGGKSPSVADLSVESRARKLASAGHPDVSGARGLPKLTDRDRRALLDYLAAYRNENPGVEAPQGPPSGAHAGGGVVPSANAAVSAAPQAAAH